MKSLKEIILEAENKKCAIGHFNFSNIEMFKAIAQAAKKINLAVIVGLSDGEREFIGAKTAVNMVKNLREELEIDIFLNADHTRTLAKAEEAARAGFDSIIFDVSHLPLEENIKKTREAVGVIKSINENILVEGELGYIGSSSEILKELPKGAVIEKKDFTAVKDAEIFVRETGVDLMAPAVGNIHGIIARTYADLTRTNADSNQHQSAQISINQQQEMIGNPPLDIQRIQDIKKIVNIPLVLHGGSGISDSDFLSAMNAGISVVHISTELRYLWRKEMEQSLKNQPEEIAPYKIIMPMMPKMIEFIELKLKLLAKNIV